MVDEPSPPPDVDWYGAVFEQAPSGILVFDRNLIVTACNVRFAEWVGSSRERMVGFDLSKITDPAPLPRMREALLGRSTSYEGPFKTANGRPLFVRTRAAPLRDTDGAIVGGITVFEDISDHRTAELALVESEERYRRLVELSPDPIFVQIDGKFAFANPAALRAFRAASPEELIGTDISRFVHEELSTVIAARIGRVLGGEAVGFIEQRFNRLDGTVGTAEVASLPMTFEGKSAVLTVARDVSDRAALEEQLRQAQKMEAVGLLAGGIAHDFNNLLTVIGFHAQSLRRGLADAPMLSNDAEEIERAAERAATLTRQLLAFSRKQIMQPRSIDVNEIIVALKRMLERLIGSHISVDLSLAPKLRRAHADAGQVEQVIMNLALNARDAMTNGGLLAIETADLDVDAPLSSTYAATPGAYVRIAVRDTGHGMTPETRARIFEPFFTTKPPGKGTGLGLSTVYGIVRQSGGGIRVESEPGHGTTFEVLLPIEREAPSRAIEIESAAGGAQELILLVEDESAVRAISKRILERAGYRVVEAHDGKHALAVHAALTEPIDLLLTDMVMPGLGGRELYLALAAQRPTLPVLYMSGYTDDEILRRGMLEGNSAFLQKPFGAEMLRQLVRSILDRRVPPAPRVD